ncbi:MAG: Ig-like domain-containing protein, partial [Lachnospiraceae bacterium]|nr:Ig-like domain-containing protein [Lachnospiraceae bacterium]
MGWYDADENELDAAPAEAGTYYYRITYKGQTGLYAAAYADIPVVIKAAELTIVPKFTEGAKFYPGMTVKQALAQVDYTVLDADKKSFDANVDRNSFWGVYNTSYTTLPFEPVFGIQVKEGTEEKINDDGTSAGTVDIYGDGTGSGYGYLSAGTTLQAGQTYRVVFTGQKAVYYGNGTEAQKRGINSAGNSFNPSYHVADGTNGDKTNEENAAAITLEPGTEAEINSHQVKDGKGSTYENPISKVYDGTGFFNKKAEYKIATVNAGNKVVAEKTNPAITYTWERQDGTEPVIDKDGNVVTDNDGNPVKVPVWVDYDYNDNSLSNLVSPVNAGKYRLTISYADGKNDKDNRGGYYAQPVEVFYEIQVQNVIIVPDAPEGGYSAHIGYTASQVLNSLYNSENLDLTGELSHKVYKLDENLQYNSQEPLNMLSGIVNAATGEGEYWHPYYVEWCIAKQNEQGTWVRLNGSDVLESGGAYELIADYWDFDFDSYANNYSTCMDAGKDEDGNQLVIYFTGGAPISLTAQGTVALDVELDTSKITAKTTKEYDGTPIGILEEVKKNLVVYKQDDANKTPVTDVLSDIQYVWSNNDNGKRVTETEPVDAGTYTLYAKFTGNASYKAFDSSNFCLNTGLTVTITPRELTVVPSLKEPIAAGYSNPSQYYDWSKTEFKNVAESDKEAFTYNSNTSGFTAVSSRGYRVCDADGNYVSKLKGNTEYTFEFAYMSLRGNYANNYVLKYEKIPFTTVRGYSSVEGTSYADIEAYKLNDSTADVEGIGTHTITANEGIEYKYNVYNSETDEYEDGNFIALRITMPEEYRYFSEAEAVYANSIEKAGGCILNTPSQYSRYINVLFNAEDGKEKPIEFDIRWEEGYVEHFILDFSKAELLEDLRNAVAPKSISLVSPSKKMVVGGTQQLDVKLTTAQIGDLIHLTYTVDKPDVLCVTESGYVTALAAGDATITIEATRRGENGEYVSTTPAKKTTLKVKVSEVSAPKIKKVDNILDGQARIWWTPLDENDGYRREIYVLEGKTNYTKQDFENKIASMKNGNWEDIFAVAPVYENTYSNTYYDSKTKLSYDYVSGLKHDTEYTVYVRNVNQVRTLTECGHDNCKVAESHDGSVKGFKTTKGQVKGLSVGFD